MNVKVPALTASLAALWALCAPVPARAQSATPPEGCETFLTVHTRSCSVSLYWRCEGAPEGMTWEASHGPDGPVSVHTYDREFQWLDAFYFETGTEERLYEAGPDPISMTELLESGVDTYDFTTVERTGDEVATMRTTGRDEATGETEVIDGVLLHVYQVQSQTSDEEGNTLFAAEGRQYVMQNERLFMLGRESYTDGTDSWQEDNSPMEFIFPGEKGFGETMPRYGCNALEAAYPLPAE